MLSGRADLGESRMGEISMSGSTRERGAAVIGLLAFHSVLSSLLYWLKNLRSLRANPGVETPDYSQMSLRDRMQRAWNLLRANELRLWWEGPERYFRPLCVLVFFWRLLPAVPRWPATRRWRACESIMW